MKSFVNFKRLGKEIKITVKAKIKRDAVKLRIKYIGIARALRLKG